jgi:hypothetical protein
VTIASGDDGFVAVYRWFSWRDLLLALGALTLAAIAFLLLPARLVGLAVAALFGGVAVYLAAVTLTNRTIIHATRTALRARHGPIPIIAAEALDAFGFWPDVHDVEVPCSRLLYVAKGARDVFDVRSDDSDAPAPVKVYLKAVLHDGAGAVDVQLLPSTASGEVEDAIGWALDAWLLRAGLPFYKGAVAER